MANRYLSTKRMVINLERITGMWFDYDDKGNETQLHVCGENLDWVVDIEDPDYEILKQWIDNCSNNKTQMNDERSLFVCSYCGAPNNVAA